MKRLLSSLLAIVFVIGVCVSAPITANAENGEMQEYTIEGVGIFQYDETKQECFVKEWLGTDENLMLAGVIDINTVSYKITRILSGAFLNRENLKTIDLNSSNIEIIETGAFAENVIVVCDNPEKITTKPEDIIFHKNIDGNIHNIESYKIENDEIVGVCTCGVDSGVFATIEYENLNEAGWAHSALVTPAEGVFVSLTEDAGFTDAVLKITDADEDITIYLKPSENENAVKVSGDLSAKLDSTAPTGEIRLDDSSFWTELDDHISFNLFFKEQKSVTVKAIDNISDVKFIEYYISDTLIDDVDSINEWSEKEADASISLKTGSKNIVYVKITDNADNVTYISSDGIVLYSDSASENQTIEYTYNENSNNEISVTFNGNTVNSIKCGAVQLDSDDYTVDTENNKITLNASYLNTLSVGEYSYTVSYNPQGETYVESSVNEAPSATKFTVNVTEADSTVSIAPTAKEDLVYTGAAQELVNVGTAIGGEMQYSLTNNGEDWSTTVPAATDAGTYNVYYRVVGNENYNDVEAAGPVTVTISKKPITITAKDVTVVVNSENQTITEYEVEGLLDGETLESVTLVAKDFESTASVADYEIEVSEAVIKNASNKDVTDNYDINYVSGKLSVVECTEHQGGTATCKVQAVCTICKKPYGEVDPDAHNPGEWKQKNPATCQAEGVMVKKCTECNKELETEAIKVLPHALGGWILETAPTCVDNGKMHRICTNDGCNYKEESEITATGVHTPGEWEVKTPATCENDGVKVKKCTVCKSECETDVIKAEHTLGEWKTTKNPTCKEEGSRERKCTVANCQYKETESINKLPHTESSWNFVEDSTCSEEGKLEKICTVCKELIETATIPVKEHDFTEWKETKAPTCVEKGEEKRECKDCGAPETREVKVLGHDFSEEFTIDLASTCTEVGSKSKHCSRCAQKSEITAIDALGHDYENVDFTIDLAPTCTEVGSKSKHCTRCEEKSEITVIEATGHIDFVFETIKEATCTTAGSMLKKCKCGEELETIITSPKEHILSDWLVDKEATCTVAGSKHKECTSCQAVLESGVIDILGHKYGEWTITKDATCFEDGSKYRICSVCEDKEIVVIEKIAHKNAEIIDHKDATCLEDGYSGDKYCPDCKEIIEKGEVLKATGHTVSDWITDKEPTFTEGGTQHKECTVCKEELQTAIIEKLTLDTPKVTVENAADGIKVKWTQDEDATGYIVYSSQYDVKTKSWSKWKNRGTLKASASSWVDEKVKKNVEYKYTVRAANGKFKSSFKESGSITFVTAPKATVTISTTGLLVKWNKIDGAESYIVYRSEKKNSKWTKWSTLGTTGEAKNTWLDDKVKSGVTYRYAIRAVDNKIKSGYIATSGMIFLEQPTLTISNSASGITGTWKKVNGAKGYTIYRSELVNGKWTNWINLGTTKETAKSFTDKTVKSGKQYKYTLRAVNGKVKSTYKSSDALMYLSEPVLKIKNETNAITGSWTQVKGAKGYSIYRSELKDGKWTKWVNLGTAKETAKTFTDKTVKSGVTYKYTVKAINGKYKSSFVSTSKLVFLSLPTVKVANNATGVKVSWNKITGAESYIVYRREYKSDKWTKWKNLGSAEKTSFIDSTVVSNTKYQYTVRAVNGESKSVYKASSTLRYIAAPVVTLEGDKTDIKVLWTKVDGAKNYTVYRSVLGEDGKWSSWQKMADVKETKSSWIDKSTEEDVVYRYTVRAVNGKLKSAYVSSEPFMIESEKEPEEAPETEQK